MQRRTTSLFFLTPVLIAAASFPGCSHARVEYQVVFAYAPGLKRGSEVRYAGVPVGKVEAMWLRDSANGAPSQVVVTIALKPGNYHVREGDRFQVESAGLLGESYIDIVPASSTGSPLPAGATIQGETPLNISPNGLSSFLDFLGLAAKINNLPPAKREEVLKTLHRIVDEAVEAAPPSTARRASGAKD